MSGPHLDTCVRRHDDDPCACPAARAARLAALKVQRADLIAALAALPPSHPQRQPLTDELRVCNANLKAANVAEDVRLKQEADVRRAAGNAEAQANAARGRPRVLQPLPADVARSQAITDEVVTAALRAGRDEAMAAFRPASSAATRETRDDLRRSLGLAPMRPATTGAPRVLTRGEFLLKHARQMLKCVESIPPDRRLPHTGPLEQALRAFVPAQAAHVADCRATREEAWKKAWQDQQDEERP